MCQNTLKETLLFVIVIIERIPSVHHLQGMMFAPVDAVKTVPQMLKLYLHEANRVYRDKLLDAEDMKQFDDLAVDNAKKFFDVRNK